MSLCRNLLALTLALLTTSAALGADVKISSLPPLANSSVVGADMMPIVDTIAVETKSINITELDKRWAAKIYPVPTYANFASLPVGLSNGAMAITLDTTTLWVYDSNTASWASQLTGLVSLTSGVSGVLPIANGGTNATTASGARTNLSAAASGANSDITSLTGLTTPLSVAQGGTGATSSTGTGAVVLASSPTLVTPNLGVPTVIVLTNATGLPASTGLTGQVPVANGGTGIASGTSGGVLAFTGSTTIASSGALTANGVVYGGGAGFTPGATAAATNNQVLVGTTGSAPSWGQVALNQSAAVTGTLAVANGGTGVTSSTGTTAVVLSNGPTLVAPVLGTPASGTLTNATGLPLTSGVTGTLPTGNGGTGVTSVTTTPTATSFAGWDANKNFSSNIFLEGTTTTTAAAGTTTLTAGSTQRQILSGGTIQSYVLPDATTLPNGAVFEFNNNSSGTATIKKNGGSTLTTLTLGGYIDVILLDNSTSAGTWDWHALIPSNSSWNTSGVTVGGTSGLSAAAIADTGLATAGATVNNSSGVLATVTNSTATNEFLTQSSSGTPAWATILAADVPSLAASKITSGTLAVAQGGTNLASGTSGGVLAYTASGTLASSGALTANGVVYGGGAGFTPGATAAGTNNQVLVGNTSAAPTWGTVALGSGSAVSGTLATGNGGTGVASVTTAPTASSFAGWDANKNLSTNALIAGYATTATAGGTTTLAVGDKQLQYFTGSLAQQLNLPDTSTLVTGQSWTVVNNSSGSVTVKTTSGTNLVQTMAASSYATYTCVSTGSNAAASWNVQYATSSAGGGSVTSVAMTVPSFLSVSGSPVTTSGTLGVTLSGTALPVANGGTGDTTLASNGVLYGNSTSAVQALAVNSTATNEFLTQSSSGAPAWAALQSTDMPQGNTGGSAPATGQIGEIQRFSNTTNGNGSTNLTTGTVYNIANISNMTAGYYLVTGFINAAIFENHGNSINAGIYTCVAAWSGTSTTSVGVLQGSCTMPSWGNGTNSYSCSIPIFGIINISGATTENINAECVANGTTSNSWVRFDATGNTAPFALRVH